MSAELQGSYDQSGVMGPGIIERGRYLRFMVEDSLPITTSRVQGIYVTNPSGAAPGSTARVN
jgi:hypothetical protein